ncbi:hypothetical protein [Mesorhizobium sp. 1M-11]|uniref:hypothetical protein n=1 Tax=Mesorhizobium sp. 1M-11 TaxID=1529006 RepID=UPI00128F4A68|nr:hypothetical protein [Mesorhizobium sp. 1M-11]
MSEPLNAMNDRLSEPQGRRIRCRDMADALERMAHGKQFWLADFGRGRRKRPDHEILQKSQELDVLQQAARDYRTQQFQEQCDAVFRPRENQVRRP